MDALSEAQISTDTPCPNEIGNAIEQLTWLRRWYNMFLLMGISLFIATRTRTSLQGPAAVIAGMGSFVLFFLLISVATMWKPKRSDFSYFDTLALAGTLLFVWWVASPLGAIVAYGAVLILDRRLYARIKALKAGMPKAGNDFLPKTD